MTADVRTVPILIAVVNTPPQSAGLAFGLQDKSGAIRDGTPDPNGSIVFECDIQALRSAPDLQPTFRGAFTHGPPKNRHLYLSYGRRGAIGGWIKRIKLPLSPITWAMIDAAQQVGLETDIDGRGSGTVPVTWRVRRAQA
jgi:hypothetical protein